MFIHFGLYSEFGGVYQGKPVDNGYSEQIMANTPIPISEYAAAAKDFDPKGWDPDAIVSLAKAAGMRYIVITSKHHDGFNLFGTKQTKYNVVDGTPYHRDIIKELAEACRRGGIAFGVYYSSIDWHEPGMDHYIEGNSNELSDDHARFNAAQLHELLSSYGPISEIWFDMGKPTPAQSELFAMTVHKLQPETMVSGRVWNYQGDFTVMGDNEVPRYGIDEPWQTPASIFNDTWGYRSWQKRENPEEKIHENILKLVQVVSRGGNYILNIGPKGDGSVVPYEADVLHGIGAWLNPHSEAIYGTTASPFADLNFGYVTLKERNVYLFIKDTSKPIVLPDTAETDVTSAMLLDQGDKLRVSKSGANLIVDSPAHWQSGFLPVIKLSTSGGLVVKRSVPHWNENGAILLTAETAEKFYNYNGRGYEAPKTLYKMRWYLPQGCAHLQFHTQEVGNIAVVTSGHQTLFQVSDGAEHQVEIGADHMLELTPQEPFVKGTTLPISVKTIDVKTCTQPIS